MRDRPTLQDVAERAGVSRALVSIVMREAPGASAETRVRVRTAADEIGYRPDPRARMLRSQRTKLLGVVFTPGQEFHAGSLQARSARGRYPGGVVPARRGNTHARGYFHALCSGD